jgi:hypothetical protein
MMEESDAQAIATGLLSVVQAALPGLQQLDDQSALQRHAPDKWSAKEIIGHLIDSAANNHQRIVRARFGDALVFDGYDQDAWVAVHGYHHVDWLELLTLWVALNRQIARAITSLDLADLERPRARHNLDVIGWETVPLDQPVTLSYLVRDYINHLRHHLRQIDGALAEEPLRQR